MGKEYIDTVTVQRLDGSTTEAQITRLDYDMSCAVIHQDGQELVIVSSDGHRSKIWLEVVKHGRGDTVYLRLRKKDNAGMKAMVIHVLEETEDDPLTYLCLAEGAREADIATPYELIEAESIPGAAQPPLLTGPESEA